MTGLAPPAEMAGVLREHERRLAAAGVPSPAVDVRLLAEHAGDLDELASLVARRAERVPLQHLTGRAPFRHLDLLAVPGVFVPRPETEILVGHALEVLPAGPSTVVDVGTGSGAVALAIATERADARVVATDADPGAVALARRNLARVEAGAAGVASLASGAEIEILLGDLLEPVPAELCGHLDLLVSNPPYLPAGDRQTLPAEVAAHDPPAALYGGADGYEVVDRLARAAASWLRPGGAFVCEIDDRRPTDALAVATSAGLVDARVRPDLTGRDRVLVARRPARAA